MKASLSQHQQTSAEKEHKLNSSEGVHTQGLRQYSIFYCHTLSIISSLLQWISCILNPLLNETPFEHCWQPQLPECHCKLRHFEASGSYSGDMCPTLPGNMCPTDFDCKESCFVVQVVHDTLFGEDALNNINILFTAGPTATNRCCYPSPTLTPYPQPSICHSPGLGHSQQLVSYPVLS